MSAKAADTLPEAWEHGAARKKHKSKKRKHTDEVAQPDESSSKKKKKRTTVPEYAESDRTKSAGLALGGTERPDPFTKSQSQDFPVQVLTGEAAQPVKRRKKNKPVLDQEQEKEPPAPELVKNKTPPKAPPPPRVVSRQSSSPHPQTEKSAEKEKKRRKQKDAPAGEHSGEAKRKPSKHAHSSPEIADPPGPSKAPARQPEQPQPKKKRKRESTPDEDEDEPAESIKSAKKHKDKKQRTPSPKSPEPVAPTSTIVEVPATAEEASDSSSESTAEPEAHILANGADASSSTSTAASDSIPQAIERSSAEAQAKNGVEDQEDPEDAAQEEDTFTFDDDAPSPFHSTRLSVYVPIPARSLDPSTALSSLSAEHLAPTLLTYYPPAKGVVLAFSDCALSSARPQTNSKEEIVVMAMCGDQYGVSYIWLTVTVLAFMPERGMELSGWMNVCSEGFVGLVSYNYFQVGIAKERIPKDWTWRPAGGVMTKTKKKGRKAQMSKDGSVDTSQETSQETAVDRSEDDGAGYFVDASGTRVSGTQKYRVVDCEVVPGAARDTWTLQVEGTLLEAEDEAKVAEEDQEKEMRQRNKASGRAMMSGALAGSASGH